MENYQWSYKVERKTSSWIVARKYPLTKNQAFKAMQLETRKSKLISWNKALKMMSITPKSENIFYNN